MGFATHYASLTLTTKKRLEFVVLTDKIEAIVSAAGIKEGVAVVQSHHTTARLWMNEDEKNLIGHPDLSKADLHMVLDRFAHPEEEYGHNDVKTVENPTGKRDTHLCNADGSCECINGHAHAQALLLPASITLIVHEGKLVLGEWQEIMLVELDHNRKREISVQVQGEKA